ncbi:flagellar basal body P-ring formation chaperone FlgA [Rhizobium tubonense]|jgi:flagella basal body P-ring formation protein FlgA|uniref:Flagella basal body P-ring formation protein FlgA n=1 Tax=Rhizobium tubonense TaxID=484088 RepID=A0A2W4E9P8_9HYPH|nr:flagellar basal body P-ring formation chaperone FlgA [Rhizobium tubonense]PZM12006.1 flagella basal body P-ring formation protein FlgA [Rhizobium tubonense]
MMFRRARSVAIAFLAVASLAAGLLPAMRASADGMGYAVVPTEVIYPGDVISSGQLELVEVTNPNLVGDYAKAIKDVTGLVSKRTLLAGRTISVSSLREPFAVTRGANVRLVMNVGAMTITAAGTPLDDGAVGDMVRARNMDSGIIVSGTVLENGTIRVVAK